MRIAVATTVLPVAPSGGGEVATRAFVDALSAAGHEVTVVGYLRPEEPDPGDERFRVAGRRPIETATAGRATKAAWLARAVATRRGFSEAKYVSRAYRVPDADLVVVDHAQVGWAARRPFVHIAHNVETALYAEQAETSSGAAAIVARREAKRLAAAERRLAREARAVWTLTSEDAAAFEALGATTRAFALPATRAGGDASAGGEARGAIALLGTWTWAANLAGLRWFLGDVLPRLPESLEVVVAGRGSEEAVDGTRAKALGFVDDAAAFLAGGAVIAVPSIAGAGVQVKTLDAIASGAPVVATTIAMRGIGDPPSSVAVEDDPRGFADALVAATQRPRTDGAAWAKSRAERFAEDVARAAEDAARG